MYIQKMKYVSNVRNDHMTSCYNS